MRGMRRSLFFIAAFGAALSLGACKDKEVTKEPVKAIKKTEAVGKPKISAVDSTFDFGKVKQGSAVEHVFKIRNTGDKDLTIKSARGS